MKTLPVWSVVVVAGLSGYVGGLVSGESDRRSETIQTVGQSGTDGQMILAGQQNGTQVGGVRVQASQPLSEIVMVGPTLRIVSQQGLPVAAFATTPEGGELYLLDSSGRPSVVFQAGGMGQVLVSGRQTGGLMQMGTGQGQPTVALTGSPEMSQLKFSTQGRDILTLGRVNGGGSGLTLLSKESKPMVELLAQAKSGYLVLKKSDGKLMAEMDFDASAGGVLKLFGEKESRHLDLLGEGGAQFYEKGAVKATFPPKDAN